jgi:hypothetical protein
MKQNFTVRQGALDGVEAFSECRPTPKLSRTATPNSGR